MWQVMSYWHNDWPTTIADPEIRQFYERKKAQTLVSNSDAIQSCVNSKMPKNQGSSPTTQINQGSQVRPIF